jgi:hypothetical protein
VRIKGNYLKILKALRESVVFLVSAKALYPAASHPLFSTLKHYTNLKSLKFTGGFLC